MTTDCPACLLYRHSRESLIKAEIAKTTPPSLRQAKWERFMAGVHDRHLAVAANRLLGRFSALVAYAADVEPEQTQGCECTELCSMGPTCPGGMLAGLPGSGCARSGAQP